MSMRSIGPVIDGDPLVPLSETERIRPFDEIMNYIGWLMTSSEAVVRAQEFRDKNGERVPAPQALLYQYLRQAFLAGLAESSVGLLARLRPQMMVQESAHALVGFDGSGVVPDEAAVQIDSSAIGLSRARVSVGQHLLTAVRAPARFEPLPSEAEPLLQLNDALGKLRDLPTARLERLFAEHMDICSYRLDAWHSAPVRDPPAGDAPDRRRAPGPLSRRLWLRRESASARGADPGGSRGAARKPARERQAGVRARRQWGLRARALARDRR